MCEKCGREDCQPDRFNPVPANQFYQFMIIVLGDLAVKLTHQIEIQHLLRTKSPEEVMKVMLEKDLSGNDPLSPNEIGPRFIMMAYHAAVHTYVNLEKEFDMKVYEDNEELEALNQPKINERFWQILYKYMEDQGVIGIANSSNLDDFNIDASQAETQMQRSINQAVDEMMHKGNGKKPLIN
jgi:hypothetical protein